VCARRNIGINELKTGFYSRDLTKIASIEKKSSLTFPTNKFKLSRKFGDITNVASESFGIASEEKLKVFTRSRLLKLKPFEPAKAIKQGASKSLSIIKLGKEEGIIESTSGTSILVSGRKSTIPFIKSLQQEKIKQVTNIIITPKVFKIPKIPTVILGQPSNIVSAKQIPSIYAGTGLYERTHEVAQLKFLPAQTQSFRLKLGLGLEYSLITKTKLRIFFLLA